MQILKPTKRRFVVETLSTPRETSSRRGCEPRVRFCEQEQLTVNRLATLLANGIDIRIGQRFPDGWESAEGRRMRKHSVCLPEYKTAAHRLLAGGA